MTRFRTGALLAGGAVATTALGVLIGSRWLFPVLGAMVPLAVFLPRIRDGRHRDAAGLVLLWAVFQSLAVGGTTLLAPDRAGDVVLRGPEYAAEMLHWVRTGEGPEGSPRLYLPIHARHYAAFCVLSVVSIGALGLVLGTVLLNYMNFYVAELVRASADPAVSLIFGWPLWAAIRVVGFVITGAAMAALGWSWLERLRGRSPAPGFPGRLFAAGLGLVVLDAVLKALLAPAWRGILIRSLEGG